jgi:uncharacterized membrane protein
MRSPHRLWFLVCLLTVLLVVLATLPPFVPLPLRTGLMALFAPVCHQLPERSLWIEGVQLAVCHRCYGIYVGLFFGVTLFPFLPPRLRTAIPPSHRLLLVALLPATLDWSLEAIHLWSGMPLSRLLTGLWLGSLAGLLMAATLRRASVGQPG